MDEHEEGVGRITRRTNVDTNVVADKGEENRMEDVETLSQLQYGRRVPVPSQYQVRVVNSGLDPLIHLFVPASLVFMNALEN